MSQIRENQCAERFHIQSSACKSGCRKTGIATIARLLKFSYHKGMKHVPKDTTDDALIQEFLNKGGKVSVGKTKPLSSELGLSNNQWNNKLTKEEKAARDKK